MFTRQFWAKKNPDTFPHIPNTVTPHTEPESVGNLITQHTAVSFSLTKHFFACLAPSLGVIKWGCNNSSETCTLKKKKKKKREAEKWESVFRIKKRWWSIMAVTSSTTSRRSYMVEGLHFDDLRISWSCWLHQLLTFSLHWNGSWPSVKQR